MERRRLAEGGKAVQWGREGLTSGSGPSTYPANRDFKGHVGARGASPQGFFYLFFHIFEFFCYIFTEQKGDVLTNV
jgi:hypothetical protein